jgi:DNA-binding response OmpR family regulator
MVPRVLVVEDDPVIGSTLESSLRIGGFETEWAATAGAALGDRASDPDLILLDVGLPDGDGFAVCRELRLRYGRATIVMLTARRDPLDVVAGLESGADDYLFKPFSVVELMARVRAHLRRSGSGEQDERRLEVGSLLIDRGSRSAWLGELELPLRQREFDLLARLALSSGDAVSRETLITDVWDENWFGSTKTLDVHIVSLRRKLADAASASGLEVSLAAPVIRTLRGHGYQLQLGASRPERD